jgi:hypothetical protein
MNGWLEQLRIVSGYWVYDTVPESGQAVTTLRRAAIVITGAGPAARRRSGSCALSSLRWTG